LFPNRTTLDAEVVDQNPAAMRSRYVLGIFPEETMPSRRTIEAGSFSGHFDELVKQFAGDGEIPSHPTRKIRKVRKKPGGPAHLNQALSERSAN
jgi:hypothetical protein